MCMQILPACMYIVHVPHVCSAHGDQKKALKLQKAVSCHLGVWELNLGPLREQCRLLTLSHFSSPVELLIFLLRLF